METKTCTCCKKEYPATSEYFSKDKKGINGLHCWCKECRAKDRKRKYSSEDRKEWYQDNKLLVKASQLRKRGYPYITPEILQKILDNFKNDDGINVCPYCNREMAEDDMIHFDHFVPYSKGNEETNTLSNILPVCRYCNRSKQDEDFLYWYKNQFFHDKKRAKKLIDYVKRNELIPFFIVKKYIVTHGRLIPVYDD